MITANYFFYNFGSTVKSLSITSFPDDFGQNLQSVSYFFAEFGRGNRTTVAHTLHIDDFNEHFCENFTGDADCSYFAYNFERLGQISQIDLKFFQFNDNFFKYANKLNCYNMFYYCLYQTGKVLGESDITINFIIPSTFGKNATSATEIMAFRYFCSNNQNAGTNFRTNPKIFDFSNCNYVKQYNSSNANDFMESAYYYGYGSNTIKWNGDETNEQQVYYLKNLNFNGNTVIFDPPFSTPIPDGFTDISEFNWNGFYVLFDGFQSGFDVVNSNVIIVVCSYNPTGAISTAAQYRKILLFYINDDGEFLAFKETGISGLISPKVVCLCYNSPFIFPDSKYHFRVMLTNTSYKNYTLDSTDYSLTENSGIYQNISTYSIGNILFMRNGKDYNDQLALCSRFVNGWSYPTKAFYIYLPDKTDFSTMILTELPNLEYFAMANSVPLEIKNNMANSLFILGANPYKASPLAKFNYEGNQTYTFSSFPIGQSLPYNFFGFSVSTKAPRIGKNFAWDNLVFQARTTDGPINQYLFILKAQNDTFAVTMLTSSSFGKTGNIVRLISAWSSKLSKEIFLFGLSSENGTFMAHCDDPINTIEKISDQSWLVTPDNYYIINSTLYIQHPYNSSPNVINLSEYF